ncbi:MAG: hypothetical protein QF524_03165, partial [Planctomycetota bacterium]|nr:hypothetical protein [Planctomycetota bacterium]
EASFSNNCQILTEGSENHFSEMLAASARFNWSEDKINGLALRGPVSFSNGPTLRWGVADGGLWLEPGGSGYAWGGIAGYLRNGFFSAATCEFSNEQASLRGPVQFANGTGGCDLLIVDTAGNAKMEGNASLQLEDDFHLQADRVLREIQVEGKSETVTATGNVFAKFQSREGVAATLRANHLVYSPDWHYTKEPGFQAEGKIQLEQGQTKFLGRSFRFQKNGRAQLVGWPASGKIQTQNGLLRISSERILLDNEWVFPSGDPKLVLPAPDLGLTGKDISISSKRMSYNLETTSWELLGDVRFLGGLRGRAQKVIGRPEAFEFFPGALGFCVLSGTLKEGDEFYLKAKNIKAFPDGHLRLYGNAKAVIGASDSDSLELEGREAMFTQNGGWMKSHVLVKFGTISGQANEVSWNRLESGDHSVTLLGAAHLSDPETKAGGQEIRYETAGPYIYVLGKRGELASISFSDGGTATGEWLQFDLANRLLSGEGGTLIKP